ncbi:DNA polymerase III subunit delta' [Caminibacter pacificus]
MNKLIITNDFQKAIEEIPHNELFLRDELKMEDVQDIKRTAYIAEKNKKIILIAAKKYNIYAQNALLKILEESPKNIEFIVLASSKHLLLDTILSRLALEKRIYESQKADIKIDNITNEKILELLQKDSEKEEILAILKELLKKDLNEEQLKILNDAVMMIELNIDPKAVLSLIMLSLKVKQ